MLRQARVIVCSILLMGVGHAGVCAAPTATIPVLPNSQITPGDTNPAEGGSTDPKVVCGRSTRTVRNVPTARKHAVYKEYDLPDIAGWGEVDHLISLELGGSNDIKNLWPEKWNIDTPNGDEGAHTKDKLENRLHELVCSGKITLPEAQKAISTNWVDAYHRYMP